MSVIKLPSKELGQFSYKQGCLGVPTSYQTVGFIYLVTKRLKMGAFQFEKMLGAISCIFCILRTFVFKYQCIFLYLHSYLLSSLDLSQKAEKEKQLYLLSFETSLCCDKFFI